MCIDQKEIPVTAVLRPPLPPTNLYFMSIMRIHEVKSGPFHEHSSQLYSIATGVQYWSKVHTGLFKMYEVCDSSELIAQLRLTHSFAQGRGAWQACSRAAHPPRRPIGVGSTGVAEHRPWTNTGRLQHALRHSCADPIPHVIRGTYSGTDGGAGLHRPPGICTPVWLADRAGTCAVGADGEHGVPTAEPAWVCAEDDGSATSVKTSHPQACGNEG